jgi:PAS domain S-box-containing protein
MDLFENISGNEIFKELFTHSVVGMSVTSIDGRLNANASFCEMIGYSEEELQNQKWADYTYPDDIELNLRIIESILTGRQKSARWEKRYLHKKGSIIWVDIHTFLLRDDDGNPLHFITTVNDISARKKAEEENHIKAEKLQQSNAEKDRFFTILAHDLRRPISSFMGLSEILAKDINSMSITEIGEIAKLLHQSASNLFQLLENLLEWSILKKGNFNFHPVHILLSDIIKNSLNALAETAQRKNLTINIDLEGTVRVNCDQKMTETIFRNLISNAIKFTNRGGNIVITAIPLSSEEIQISVTDTGIGMNEKLFQNLFKLCEHPGRKGTEGESSSGLGLLICKELVDKQGGRIWAESSENLGSSFYFTLKIVV